MVNQTLYESLSFANICCNHFDECFFTHYCACLKQKYCLWSNILTPRLPYRLFPDPYILSNLLTLNANI